ncbi:MAG TPA: RNA polymerase sigma factor [Rhizomicrobium sp.]|nr:RNA polymerase sigma factor [Rhizomicrobium sp.]
MREVLPLEPMLTRFLQRNRCSAAEIADLSQETYVRIYETAHRERPVLVKPFLFQIARNLMIDRLRKQSVVSLETVADFDWINIPDDKPSSETQTAARQELRLLQAALDDLPPRCRQIVMMRRVEGLSQKEVAQRLGITVETVETQIAKGMRLLAQAIGGRRAAVTTEARRHNFLKRPRNAR